MTRGLDARFRAAAFGCAALAIALLGPIHASAQDRPEWQGSGFLRIDPERIVLEEANGFTPCGECHTAEWEVWSETAHATGFDELHRTDSAQDILRQMDLRVTKRQESLCMRCHYTVGPDLSAIAGVSCESCHGPARDWINIHNVWGEGITHPDDETAEHRADRIAQAEAGGMLRPSGAVYSVAANCYECHTVPNEELVNRGGHSTGSNNFELVARSNEILHNFVHRQWGDESGNRPQSQGRKRILFVVGQLLDYEFALRGLAEASAEGRYARSMERRAQQAYQNLEGTAGLVEIPQVLEALAIERDLVPENGDQLREVSEQVRALGQDFSAVADTTALAPLDPYLEEGLPPVLPDPDSTEPAEPNGGDAPPVQPGTPEAGSEAAAPPPAAPEVTLPGQIRARPSWHEAPSQYAYVGEGECVSCHAGAEEWWYGDPHQSAARGLLGDDPKARQIAELYGIGAGSMARGDAICMSCHGTVDEASGRVLSAGVSCESCHGAGSGFLDPHEDGGNPQLGMRALKDATVRAQNCTRCHLVTDERLLATGHPSGSGYDIAAANQTIEHWPGRRPDEGRSDRGEPGYAAVSGAALQSAYANILAGRPIPSVEVVSLPTPLPTAAATPTAGTPSGGTAPTTGQRVTTGDATPLATGAPSRAPVGPASYRAPGGGNIDPGLEPLPEGTDELPTEELLLLIKERLDRIYDALGGAN